MIPFLKEKAAVREAVAQCVIAVAPSVFESFGLSIAEAMACGCAVVAARTGFAAGLRDGVEACLLDPPASPLLYQRVRSMLIDDALRRTIAVACYECVQRPEWGTSVDRLTATHTRWSAERLAAQRCGEATPAKLSKKAPRHRSRPIVRDAVPKPIGIRRVSETRVHAA